MRHGLPAQRSLCIPSALRRGFRGPQFLRQVENEGLISPSRTESNIRLYSEDDLGFLSRIVYLSRVRGVNFQGIR